ncbi:MAG: hypothetical protein Q9202_000231 [Teloschistes flavicans]
MSDLGKFCQYQDINEAAKALQDRLDDAGKENVVEMVVDLYRLSRAAGKKADEDAAHLEQVFSINENRCRDPATWDTWLAMKVRPHTMDCLISTVLGMFSDEEAAALAADSVADAEDTEAEALSEEGEDGEDVAAAEVQEAPEASELEGDGAAVASADASDMETY